MEEHSREIKQRLVAYDNELQLKQTLRKKVKPFTMHPERVPMAIFVLLIHLDGSLLAKFAQLCKGMRKHLLFEFRQMMDPAV